MTLSHRINTIHDRNEAVALTQNYYEYRARVLRSLNEEIEIERKRTSDLVLNGMMCLMLADVRTNDQVGTFAVED